VGRVLGVDVGTRRTGLAVSDVLGITCRPLAVVKAADTEEVVRHIAAAALEHEVEAVVVGIPRSLRGDRNAQLAHTESVVESLRETVPMPVRTWDERYTTKMARRLVRPGEELDAVAAAFMLQNYLDAQEKQS